MYSSDTDAHNHVNSHVLRRITYMTCKTSHTYNTLPVLFSNLLPSSCVSPRSAHYWQHYYLKTNNISKVSYYSCEKVYVPHLSTVGVELGVKGMFLPLVSRSVDPVCFNIIITLVSDYLFTSISPA